MSKSKISVGGQALIEGIMMQGPKGCAMSLRMPDGSIETSEKEVKHIKDKYPILGKPVIRGVVNFVESLILGYSCLMESAEKTTIDDISSEEENMSKLDKWLSDHFGPKMMAVISIVSIVLSFVIGFFLFLWLPSAIVDLFNNLANGGLKYIRPLLEGIIRMGIFVGYMFAVSFMKDIKRVFMYHGAEHKSIFCFESGLPLTVENVRKQSRFHPRCGTSFIFVILIISILLSSLIAVIFPGLRNIRAVWMLVKILLLPVVAGLGYEFIKYAGTHDNKLVCVLSQPGLWMQRITTKEPDDSMIEVGIAALTAVLEGIEEANGDVEIYEAKPEEITTETSEDFTDEIDNEIKHMAPDYNPNPVNFEDDLKPLEGFDDND